ncbi:MAG: MarR family transcriptional regulator [Rhodobacteraceae bacterium]|nr:MarR family transcriptional regulator [Paracoccaceae bacterium]|tara:strand:- start:6 stop:449 length:444 start_codon:yes stop_codon:yes gene_type:complete
MNDNSGLYFTLFNEIGILQQLGRAQLEAHLPEGLIAPHFGVLNHLIRFSDGRTPLELARAFQVAKTTMSHTVAGLEKHGCIDLRPNPDDRRSKQVWLTEKGRSVRDAAIAGLAPEMLELVEIVPPDRVQQMVKDLEQLRRYMDARRD